MGGAGGAGGRAGGRASLLARGPPLTGPQRSANHPAPRLFHCPRRRLGLEFGQSRALRSAHTGGVTWLDLDAVEQRYLLAGAADASVAIYDTQAPPTDASGSGGGLASGGGAAANLGNPGSAAAGGGGGAIAPVAVLTKPPPGGHRFSVSSVAWYPVDTGLFVTGGWPGRGVLRAGLGWVGRRSGRAEARRALLCAAFDSPHAPATRSRRGLGAWEGPLETQTGAAAGRLVRKEGISKHHLP